MAVRQVIIDGVDVSECKHYYFDGKCKCMYDSYLYPQCDINPNCGYKRLKRKEQECDQLKAENMELKAENKELEEENKGLYVESEHSEIYIKELEKDINVLEQTLQEIKEIAEAITNGTHFSDDVEAHLKEMVKQILQKCEVLSEI